VLNGALTVNNGGVFKNGLRVNTGNTVLVGPVQMQSGLTVSGQAQFNGNAIVGQQLTVNKNLVVGGNVLSLGTVSGASVTSSGLIKASGNITSSATVTGRYLQPTSTETAGTACSSSGLMAKDSSGFILSCQSNQWKRQFIPSVTIRDDGAFGSDVNTQLCNSDEVVIGGGGQCQDPSTHFIHYSAPSGNNGWSVNCFGLPGYADEPARAYAICLKKGT